MRYYLLLVFLFLIPPKTHACELLNNLALKRMDAGYTFIKSYRIDGRFRKRQKITYTLVLRKNTFYQVSLAEKMHFKEYQLKASLYNSRKKLVVTNEKDGKLLLKLNLQAPATGIYYLEFNFTKDIRACGAAVLGFYNFRLAANTRYALTVEIDQEECQYYPYNKENKEKPPLMFLWFVYIDEQFRAKITMCYQESEWTETFQAQAWTDQTFTRVIERLFYQKNPNTCVSMSKISPFIISNIDK